jgi:hypothetical protein
MASSGDGVAWLFTRHPDAVQRCTRREPAMWDCKAFARPATFGARPPDVFWASNHDRRNAWFGVADRYGQGKRITLDPVAEELVAQRWDLDLEERRVTRRTLRLRLDAARALGSIDGFLLALNRFERLRELDVRHSESQRPQMFAEE